LPSFVTEEPSDVISTTSESDNEDSHEKLTASMHQSGSTSPFLEEDLTTLSTLIPYIQGFFATQPTVVAEAFFKSLPEQLLPLFKHFQAIDDHTASFNNNPAAGNQGQPHFSSLGEDEAQFYQLEPVLPLVSNSQQPSIVARTISDPPSDNCAAEVVTPDLDLCPDQVETIAEELNLSTRPDNSGAEKGVLECRESQSELTVTLQSVTVDATCVEIKPAAKVETALSDNMLKTHSSTVSDSEIVHATDRASNWVVFGQDPQEFGSIKPIVSSEDEFFSKGDWVAFE
jgi:hypothetical protein